MQIWRGQFKGNHPCIDLQVAGTKGHPEEVAAIVDTGFDGFMLWSARAAEPHGVTPIGTTLGTLADGSQHLLKTAMISVGFSGCTRKGVVVLSSTPCPCLVGTDFLRRFDLALVITASKLCLVPAMTMFDALGEFAGPAPQPLKV